MEKAFIAFVAFSNPEICEKFVRENELTKYYEPQCIVLEWEKEESEDGQQTLGGGRAGKEATAEGG